MCAKLASTSDVPSRQSAQRFRVARKATYMDVKDAKMALDIIIRPSLQLCKLVLRRGALTALKRTPKAATLDDSSESSSTSSVSPKKKVRFNERPITISRRSFFERSRKDSISSPARPCLVIREHDVPCESPKPPPEPDCLSVYEDCLSDYPGYVADLQVLEGDERSDTRSLKYIRRSEFYETESGIATFDRTGYANYCLSKWLDKQREEAREPKKLVFEDPVLLPWPSRTLPPPPSNPPDVVRPMPKPLPPLVCRPPRSLPRYIWKRIEDELQNAFVVFLVGLFIHLCLFIFLLYDILTRGLIPSDD